MQRRRCPSCGELVRVLDQSIGTVVECHHCGEAFEAKPLCPHCRRPVSGGECDCDGERLKPPAGYYTVDSNRHRVAQGLLIAAIALALVAIAVFLMNPSGGAGVEPLLRYAPAESVGVILADAAALRRSDEMGQWINEVAGPLPLTEQVETVGLFIFPSAAEEENAAFELTVAGVADYGSMPATELNTAAAEGASPTVVAGREGYETQGLYLTVMEEGMLFFSEDHAALRTLIENYPDPAGPPAPLRGVYAGASEGDVTVGVIFNEQMRTHGPALAFEADGKDLRQVAIGASVGEQVTLNATIRLKNRTTARHFAEGVQEAAGQSAEEFAEISIEHNGESVNLSATCSARAACRHAESLFTSLLAPPSVVYEGPAAAVSSAPEDTPIQNSP